MPYMILLHISVGLNFLDFYIIIILELVWLGFFSEVIVICSALKMLKFFKIIIILLLLSTFNVEAREFLPHRGHHRSGRNHPNRESCLPRFSWVSVKCLRNRTQNRMHFIFHLNCSVIMISQASAAVKNAHTTHACSNNITSI